jgi:hypothetical protein
MIFVIVNYGVDRNQEGRSWVSKALVFAAFSTASATLVGATVALVGTMLPRANLSEAAVVLALLGIVLGLLELTPAKIRPPQIGHETAQRWMNMGALRGSAMNGAALGAGFVTRIGYWAWYVLPAGALLMGRIDLGILLFAVYGLTRGIVPLIAIAQLLLKPCEARDLTALQTWMMNKASVGRKIAAGQLIATSVAIFFGIG